MEVSIVMGSEANQLKITRVGIDLGKSAFHVHAVDSAGMVVMETVHQAGTGSFCGRTTYVIGWPRCATCWAFPPAGTTRGEAVGVLFVPGAMRNCAA